MTPAGAALWGLLGGAVVEAFDTADVMRRTGKWPWRTRARQRQIGFGVWLISLLIRLGAGAGTAAAAGAGGLFANEIGAFVIGAGGPLALQAIIARTSTANAAPLPKAELDQARPNGQRRERVNAPNTSKRQTSDETTPPAGLILKEVPDET